ncbi:MAG: squalene/phytoene synthase family protein [Caulobacteraceae bacterium]
MADDAADLDGLIRRVDPDRWLTSRFVGDAAARADVIALYAVAHELARARLVASTPLLAEMRLVWWREAVEEMFGEGPVRQHPAAEALARAARSRSLPRAALEAMIEGHIAALEGLPLGEAATLAWAEAVEGETARLAALILDPSAPAQAAVPAGRAYGLAVAARSGLANLDVVHEPLRRALAEARVSARRLGVKALPAALPARLARFDLAGRRPGPLAKQTALILSAATGRI